MAKNLFIGNLSYSTTETTLRDAFAKYGASQVRVMDGRGFGFVEVDDAQAASAIEEMHDQEIDGRRVVVNEARPRENKGFNGAGKGGYRKEKTGRSGRW